LNPFKHLSPALYARLSNALTLAGAVVPVHEHLPGNHAGHYVLLQQPLATRAPGSAGCQAWSCTVLVDVVTQFPTQAISSVPANELADQITELLDFQRLTVPGYDCGPGLLETLGDAPPESIGELVVVRRLLRYRWQVHYHAAASVVPVPAQSPYYNFLYA
jgi:hypothetical protein